MDLPNRKQIRLPDYDYSAPGAYFVTVCTQNRRCILSDISVGAGALDGPEPHLTDMGKKWRNISCLRSVFPASMLTNM